MVTDTAVPLPRPLLVTDDPELLDDLLRLAAAADVEVTVAHTAAHAAREWRRVPLVVVGTDLVAPVATLEPERHPNVVVVARAPAVEMAPPTLADADNSDRAWRAVLGVGARELLSLPHEESRLVDLLAETTAAGEARAPLIAVVGGRGGAGASLLAVALALAGVRAKLRTVLVDADPLGGGLDLLIGDEHVTGARWHEFSQRRGRINWESLRETLPTTRGVTLLTWPREASAASPSVPPEAMRAVLASAVVGTDMVITDLPRAIDPAAEEVLRRTGTVLLVVPAEVHAVIAASRIVPALRERVADLRAVVRGGCPEGVSAEAVTLTLGVPLAGELVDEPDLSDTLEKGHTPATGSRSPLARFCDSFLARMTVHGPAP
ncbi:septum site-determining protein Ssd [Salinactinospora qingdaonensis]|uniref:Septum formation initiator n=1 Tax=Salinactinospora qingdaonensis TaxID=702744 RepID=A0ABP7F3V5_9ACTN